MRIRRVRVNRDVRPVIREQSIGLEPVGDELLHLPFRDGGLRARPLPDNARRPLARIASTRTPSLEGGSRVGLRSSAHSKNWTMSADVTTSTPHARTSSIVPASTMDTYGTAQSAEYCMATRLLPASSPARSLLSVRSSPSTRSCPGSESKRSDSIRWTSFRASPSAGMK